MELDWKSIRPLNGARDKGFEELCSQLARCEVPRMTRFVRKGTPDAGVECYAILPDGSEWAWQSKYFDGLGDSQWQQLDKSIKAAIEKHPRLAKYFVCIPLDLPDARIPSRKSAKDRWDEHVSKWQEWTTERTMSVEFVYWGSHELLERLAQPAHIGRVRFWFNKIGFDDAWLAARLDEAIATAGPRYTPEIHVDLPIAWEFEAFGRSKIFFEGIKGHAREIRKKLRHVADRQSQDNEPTKDTEAQSLASEVEKVLNGLSTLEVQPIGTLPFKDIADCIVSAQAVAENSIELLWKRESEYDSQHVEDREERIDRAYRYNPFRERRQRLWDLSATLRNTNEALCHADRTASSTLLILKGKAGTGKTHLLCDIAKWRIAAGCPTVLLMGQSFTSNDAPWFQVLRQLDLASLTAEEFVGALEAAAQAAGSRALFIIDAINEGTGRTIWPNHLAAFLAHLERSPWVGVVLAVRSSYEEFVIPPKVFERACALMHEGFTDREYDACKTFFMYYGLELPSTPLLTPEFQNPLFLKTLCFGLSKNGHI